MQFTVQKNDDKIDLVFYNLVNQILEYPPDNEVEERESLRKQEQKRQACGVDYAHNVCTGRTAHQ